MLLEKILENKYIYGGLIIIISIYLTTIKININPKVSRILNSNLFRVIMLSVIAYISTKDIIVSLILALGFVILFYILQKQKIISEHMKQYNRIMDLDRKENIPINQTIMKQKKCDPVDTNTNFSFSTPIGCEAVSDEANEYNYFK
jgi:hypothetical protein